MPHPRDPQPFCYLVEVTLDTGQRLQSQPYLGDVWESAFSDPVHAAAELDDFRRRPMVEAVAVIRCSTGEVLIDLPSFAVLARARQPAREHYQLPLA